MADTPAPTPIQKEDVQEMIDSALAEHSDSLLSRLAGLEESFRGFQNNDFSNVNMLDKPYSFRRSLRMLAITPAQITANQDNYATYDAPVLRLSSDASRNITGLTNGSDGRVLFLVNIGSYNIVIKNESSSSTAANRITTMGSDITIQPGQELQLWYDIKSARWRSIGLSQDAAASSTVPRQTFVAGEAINASSTPQAVYLKASDGKVYKLDATSAGEAAYNFIGFVDNSQNVSSGASASVFTFDRGIISGFSGLTVGAYYFSTNTAGTISATAGSKPVLVGQAVTSSTLLMMRSARHVEGNPTTFGNYSTTTGTSDVTEQVTVGFRARRIKLYYFLQGQNGGLSAAAGRKGICHFSGLTQLADFVIYSTVSTAGHTLNGDQGALQTIDAMIQTTNSTTAPTIGDLNSNNGVKLTLSISAIDDSSFTIKIAVTTSGSYVESGNTRRVQIYYEADEF